MENQTTQATNSVTAICDWLNGQIPDPSVFGASSWPELIYWLGGAIVALVAVGAFRQRAKQGRATFLLHLDERWAQLKEQREEMFKFRRTLPNDVDQHNPGTRDQSREQILRDRCKKEIERLREDPNEIDLYEKFFNYLAFFETLGLMVRKKYGIIPLTQGTRRPILRVSKEIPDGRQAHSPRILQPLPG